MDSSPNLNLPYIAPSQAQKHVTHNEAIRALDALVQLSVIDRDLAAPPHEPADGDRYIVPAGATGAWIGTPAGAVAAFQDGAWAIFSPRPGWIAFVADEGEPVLWTGSAWTRLSAAIAVLNDLALLGLGTAADAVNPFAAKLNKALWTAKYEGEGGDGDLRYTMNKEAPGNVLSLLMQSDWSGRAEIGLAGSDDLSVKVSADGSDWKEALRVRKDSAATVFSRSAAIEIEPGTGTEPALAITVPADVGMFQATRYSSNAQGAVFFGRKARGTKATPEAVQDGDTLLGFRGYGHTGSSFLSSVSGAAFLLEASETYVHGSAYGTQIRFFTTANGTTANLERLRIANSGDLQMGGANTVISASRHPVLRAYTVATLPPAVPAGQLIYVSDGVSNKRLAVSDGSQWRFPDGNVVS